MSMSSFTDDSRPLLPIFAGTSEGRERDDAEPRYRRLALTWVIVATAIRFVSMSGIPLGNGEAYYFTWSRFLDWSYYDHPPLIAWMVRMTTAMGISPETVRLGPILASGLFGFLFHRLAERFVRPRAAFFALVIVTTLPVFLASSFILNPEAPLAPLWVGFLLVVERMRTRNEPWRPLLAGLLLGFAFLAKYTAVLLVPMVLLYAATSAPMRRWLRRPSFYAGGAIALALAMPVLLWNAARGWPSIALHLVERAGVVAPVAGENTVNQLVTVSSSDGTGMLDTFMRVLVGQLMSYSPLLAPLLVVALVRFLRKARREDNSLFLASFSWPALLVLLAAMVKFKDAEQHWTMVAFIPAIIGAGGFADETSALATRMRRVAAVGVGVSIFFFGLAHLHARTNAFLRMLPRDRYDAHADMINELIGWDRVSASVEHAAAASPGQVVLASNHYSMCGRLFFEIGDDPPVYCPTARKSAFDFFGRKDPPADATVILLTNDVHQEMPVGLRDRKCTQVDQVDLERDGRHVAQYLVQSCAPATSGSESPVARLGSR